MSKKLLYILLWITYINSLVLMIFDLWASEFLTNLIFFYVIANAVLLYRLFGVFWFTILVHAFVHIGVLTSIIVLNMGDLLTFYNMAIYVPLAAQLLLSLHFVVIRRGRSPDEQACHSGIHAHIGLIVIIILFWHIGFTGIRWPYSGLFTMFYMLLFLGIVLTPHFHGLSKSFLKCSTGRRRTGGSRHSQRGSQASVRSSDSQRKVKFGSGSGRRQRR